MKKLFLVLTIKSIVLGGYMATTVVNFDSETENIKLLMISFLKAC
ncbi:hypothetical protein [Clostridium estertheticum]|nr:hypothetical protein [Clostridium estertheticum]